MVCYKLRQQLKLDILKKIFFLFFIFFNLKHYSQDRKCLDFKVGKFKYTNSLYKSWIVIRNETEQIETDSEKQIELRASINWISDCEYVLTYTKFNGSINHSIVGEKIVVKMIKIKNESVICESEGFGTKLEIEMTLEQ